MAFANSTMPTDSDHTIYEHPPWMSGAQSSSMALGPCTQYPPVQRHQYKRFGSILGPFLLSLLLSWLNPSPPFNDHRSGR